MQKVPRGKIITRTIKNVGYDMRNFLGKCLLKASYPITGLLPAKCQHYLADRFESYNAFTATCVSSLTETILGLYTMISRPTVVNNNPDPISILSIYPALEGIARIRLSWDDKKAMGSLLLKIPLAPFEYFYNEYTKAAGELEGELFHSR